MQNKCEIFAEINLVNGTSAPLPLRTASAEQGWSKSHLILRKTVAVIYEAWALRVFNMDMDGRWWKIAAHMRMLIHMTPDAYVFMFMFIPCFQPQCPI